MTECEVTKGLYVALKCLSAYLEVKYGEEPTELTLKALKKYEEEKCKNT